ncbi:hypothetical protein, partial [Acinetobacter baumannii]
VINWQLLKVKIIQEASYENVLINHGSYLYFNFSGFGYSSFGCQDSSTQKQTNNLSFSIGLHGQHFLLHLHIDPS